MTNILIIEDDIPLAQGMELALREDERSFVLCHKLQDARTTLETEKAAERMLL